MILSTSSLLQGDRDTFIFFFLLVFLGFSFIFIGGLLALHSFLALSGQTTRALSKHMKVSKARSAGRHQQAAAETAVVDEDVWTEERSAHSSSSASAGGTCTAMVRNLAAFCQGRSRGDRGGGRG